MIPLLALMLVPHAGDEAFALAKEAVALLEARCWSCHGPAKQSGGLRLDSALSVSRGGDSGNPVASGALVRSITSADPARLMPPKNRLSDREISVLSRWVRAGAAWPASPALALFDDDPGFPALLTGGKGAARLMRDKPFSGAAALAVAPLQRESPSIPGWSHEIRENPSAGQYRHLRLAWRKRGPGGIMIELALSGKWPDAKSARGRFHSGPNTTGWASVQVASAAPSEWTLVTIDLWKALGDCVITGIAPTCDGGEEAHFDAILLGATVASLDAYAPSAQAVADARPVGDALTDPRNPIRKLFGGERLDLWSLRPPAKVAPPAGAMHPVDAFIGARLAAKGIQPLPQADRRTLLRRLHADLTGLPPSPAEADAFLADNRPDAYERLVDRLLASPAYGERQARLWLDVVRYADTNGYERDEFRPLAWRYRDYVIRSFNADKPFDLFAREQLAGDEMVNGAPRSPAEADALVATGYLRLGQFDSTAAIFQEEKRLRAEQMADLTNTTASAFLGLTMSCCQCHDHKYDPLSQADHYRLRAFFAGVTPRDDLSIEVGPSANRIRDHNAAVDTRIAEAKKAMAALPKEKKAEKAELQSRIDALTAGKIKPAVAMGATDSGESVPATHRLDQGAHDAPKEEVAPGFVSVLVPAPAEVTRPRPGTSGRRSALAAWIASPSNPWTARVLANRLWQQHFGTGLVATANDFGQSGARPTHPELLDWLAGEVVARGWSLKATHRLIVTSEAYKRSSVAKGVVPVSDPENRLLWRQNPRRLDAESIRDYLLAASGLLKPFEGGKPVWPSVPEDLLKAQPAILEAEKGGDGGRMQGWYPDPEDKVDVRSVYLIRKRCLPIPFLQAFDLPDPSVSCARRDTTIVAPQALTLLNSPESARYAAALAARAQAASATGEGKVDALFKLALARLPEREERALVLAWLSRRGGDQAAFAQACRAVINSNEFIHVD